MYKIIFASIALLGLAACIVKEPAIIVDGPELAGTAAADRQLLIDGCVEDLENEATCACMASANEDNLSPTNYARIVDALRTGEKFDLDFENLSPEDEEEWGNAMGAGFACSETSNDAILVEGCTDGGHSQQGCYCTTSAMKSDLSPAVYLAIVEAVKSKGEGEDPFADLTEDEQVELTFIPDAMTASCEAIGEWTGTWSEEDQANADKQSLVNHCIENGENGKTCSCLATAMVTHAPISLFDDALMAAREGGTYIVDTDTFLPDEMVSYQTYRDESISCMDTSNEAALINQCVDGGDSGDVCICRADGLKAGLSSETYFWVANAAIEGWAMEEWFDDYLDEEQQNEYVAVTTLSSGTCSE